MKAQGTRILSLTIAVLLWTLPMPSLADSLTDRVDGLFSEWDRIDSPGGAVGIVRGGELLYARGYGAANLDFGIKNSPDTNFYLASDSKQFTAACIGLLILEGKVGLDDDIRKYVPELPEHPERVRIRNLLNHTSGLLEPSPNVAGSVSRWHHENLNDEEYLAQMLRFREPYARPGTHNRYSNGGYFLLALIVERVSGLKFERFVQTRLFDPLDMNDSYVQSRLMTIPNRATGYARTGTASYYPSPVIETVLGYTGVRSTINDLVKWTENFYTGAVGGDALIDLMVADLPMADGRPSGRGFGIDLGDYRGLRRWSHGGQMAGYSSEMLHLPEQQFTVIVVSNAMGMPVERIADDVVDLYLADSMVPDTTSRPEVAASLPTLRLTAHELERFAGFYMNVSTGIMRSIQLRAGTLRISTPYLDREEELRPVGPTSFVRRGDDSQIVFEFGSNGQGANFGMRIVAPHYERHGTLIRMQPAASGTKYIESLTGLYFSQELDVAFHVYSRMGALRIRRGRIDQSLSARPYLDGFYFGAPGTREVQFLRDSTDEVEGLRAGNLLFEKLK